MKGESSKFDRDSLDGACTTTHACDGIATDRAAPTCLLCSFLMLIWAEGDVSWPGSFDVVGVVVGSASGFHHRGTSIGEERAREE